MKFPEQRLSMETALPPSVQNWLGHELEIRGIDSMVYCRHVIQLLQQEDPDEQDYSDYVDLLFDSKIENKIKFKGKRLEKRKSSPQNTEERKKNAAIECLQAVSDEDSGIETLVEELCNRLKNINLIDEKDETSVRALSPSSTDSEASSSELDDPAERYYAAFPALHGQDKDSASPFAKESIHLWKNNPITKLQITSDEGSKSENADSGNESETDVQLETKNSSKEKKSQPENNSAGEKFSHSNKARQQHRRTAKKIYKHKKDKNENHTVCRFLSWPQDASKVEVKHCISEQATYHDQDKELCCQVENLLKDMLLHKDVTQSGGRIHVKSSRTKLSGDESVSPELQEDDSWYTQPIDVLFSSDEPRQRLYKRNSNPLFPTTEDSDWNASNLSSPFKPEGDEDYDLEEKLSSFKGIFDDSEDEEEHTAIAKPMFQDQKPSNHSFGHFEPYDAFTSDLPGYGVCTSPMAIPKSMQKVNDSQEDSVLLCSFISGHNSSLSTYDNVANSLIDSLSSSNSQSSVIDKAIEDVLDHDQQPDTPCICQEQVLEDSILDREYLKNITQVDNNLESSFCSWSPQLSDAAYPAHLNCAEQENSTWPSKVLFADFVLPVDWLWEHGEIDYNTDFYNRLKYGKLWQVWDVSYQKIKGNHSWKQDVWGPPNYSLHIWDAAESSNSLSLLSADYLINQSDDYYWLNKRFLGLTDLGDENTLIPEITFDLVSECESDYDNMLGDEEYEIFTDDSSDQDVAYGRSCSFGDFHLLDSLSGQLHRTKDQLSRSFELVPSECSAFVDVIPKKIYHVQSEPNLVSCCREAKKTGNTPTKDRKSKSGSQSPEQEHLYFSPKTHFRPIQTPVNPDAVQDFHLRDLFGGYATSKTPYQKYLDASSSDSGEEMFVPMFKIRKDLDKYIQTGSSLEESNADKHIQYQRKTLDKEGQLLLPQDTLEDMTHDQNFVEEFDVFGYVDSLTHSTENTPQNLPDYLFNICMSAGCDELTERNQLSNIDMIQDHEKDKKQKREIGEVHHDSLYHKLINEEEWKQKLLSDNTESSFAVNCMCPTEEYGDVKNSQLKKEQDVNECSCSVEPTPHQWVINEAWGLDPGQNVNKEAYSIWQCNQDSVNYQDFFFYPEHECGDVAASENNETSALQSGNMDKNIDTDDACMAYTQSYKEMAAYMTQDSQPENLSILNNRYMDFSDQDVPIPKSDLAPEDLSKASDETDVVKVKLVIRKNKRKSDFEDGDIQPSNLYVPMPVAALYSCELEEAWINGESIPADLCVKSSASCPKGTVKKKPCSFFMDGHCRRTDCKFAHDLSCITCRFWEEGDCFKGDHCPFLHGYPSLCTSPEDQNTCFEYQPDEFPDLTDPLKNSTKSKTGKMNKPRAFRQPIKVSKSQSNKKTSAKEEKAVPKRCTEKKVSVKQKNSI